MASNSCHHEEGRLPRTPDSEINVVPMSSPTYPSFTVRYLGRAPAQAEFGQESVEGPVDTLVKLREKQKLQKVTLKFNKDGLYFKEIVRPLSKTKHDRNRINQFIPLHHVSFGVGSLLHPKIFACITRLTNDSNPETQMLILHAFLCEKPETTSALTYWQLQAYMEAYEELRCKKIVRNTQKKINCKPEVKVNNPNNDETSDFVEKTNQSSLIKKHATTVSIKQDFGDMTLKKNVFENCHGDVINIFKEPENTLQESTALPGITSFSLDKGVKLLKVTKLNISEGTKDDNFFGNDENVLEGKIKEMKSLVEKVKITTEEK